jgi:ribonuclease HI
MLYSSPSVIFDYFDAHPITVVSKYPLSEVIQNPEAEGRIAKWALELMGQNITYAPRNAIKLRVLANIIAEWTEVQTPLTPFEHETWTMYFDGSVMKEGVGAGLVFISPLGVRIEYMVRLHFPASNNVIEYETLINRLRVAIELRFRHLEIRGDLELGFDQVMKEKNCLNPKMAAYCRAVHELEDKFHGLKLHHVLRAYNKVADILAKTTSNRKLVSNSVFASDQRTLSARVDKKQPREPEAPEVMEID